MQRRRFEESVSRPWKVLPHFVRKREALTEGMSASDRQVFENGLKLISSNIAKIESRVGDKTNKGK